jgi:hypothetical protein
VSRISRDYTQVSKCVSGPTCRLTFLSQVMLDVRARHPTVVSCQAASC